MAFTIWAAVAIWMVSGCSHDKAKPTFGEVRKGSAPTKGAVEKTVRETRNPPRLVPGESIGPIRIGMTRDEVARLGLPVLQHLSGQMGNDFRNVGPYQVVFDQDHVVSVSFVLTGSPAGMMVGERLVHPNVSAEDLVKAIPGCGDAELREGGTIFRCGDRTVIKLGVDEPPAVEVQIIATGLSI
jgi:hypothetical protein